MNRPVQRLPAFAMDETSRQTSPEGTVPSAVTPETESILEQDVSGDPESSVSTSVLLDGTGTQPLRRSSSQSHPPERFIEQY